MRNELISVIIPAYNAENSLERSLQSVLRQTYRHLEIIIVNDGSTDGTPQIMEAYAAQDPRIIAVHQNNKGVSSARNKGLELASGMLIGFMDDDDEMLPDMYEFLYQNVLKYNADISHCGFELVKPNETVKFHDTGVRFIQNREEALEEILSGKRVEPSVCNKLYKKAVLQNVFFPDGIGTNEDLLFNVEAFLQSETSVFEDLVKYRYLSQPSSASRSAFTIRKAEDLHYVARRIQSLLKNTSLTASSEQFYKGKVLTLLQTLRGSRLYEKPFTAELRMEAKLSDVKGMGIRMAVMKFLLVHFPVGYDVLRYLYDMFFTKNQKWKN